MAVPKKRTSRSKKCIRRNIWRRKGDWTVENAISLGQFVSTGESKSFVFMR